ncbi:golgin subfamily A member 6-like protein 22 isoform X2 [Mytilus californianus]|uniref:golgin subfamily A member 6-like protein 22 isoform X2 n=1 Tax=Mytilus californianus TaxID=6549 RepID=UPI0022471AA7|nr:golgin subfamily A member 6-like protein 22 isoform X2 [Mytilus californianus]
MDTPFVAQVTEDLNTRKILQTRETIMTFTGRPPKDASHIEEVKYMIETFPHPNLDGVVHQQDTGGTVPVDSDIWGKLTDFKSLTEEQQRETREFLLMKFSVEDLQLAWDQYFVQKGEIPNCLQYRIFINNWRAEMMRALEKKDDEIYQERDEQQLLHSQLELVNHIYNGQLRRVQDLEQDNDILRNNVHQLENEVEQKSEDINHIRDITEVQGRHVYQLRRTITQKDRQICDQCSKLRDLEDTKGEYGSVIKRQKLMIKEKKDEVKAQSAMINEQSATINEQSATINEQSATINEQSATINEINVKNDEQSATINEQSATINEINVKNDEQSATINEQSATINEINVKNDEQSATINEQSATINEINVKNEDQSATINEQSATINDQSATINEQSATINDLIEQNHDKCKTINELSEKIDMEVHVGQTKEQIIAEQSQLLEEQKAIIVEQNERLRKNKKDDEDLRRQLTEQDRINQDLYDQLKDVKMLCNKLMMKIQAKSQNQ